MADLYHGNLEPSYAEDTPEIAACSQQIMQLQKKLYQGLSQDKREQIEDYRTLLDERYVRQAEQAFAAGFRCAMTMLAAGLSAQTLAARTRKVATMKTERIDHIELIDLSSVTLADLRWLYALAFPLPQAPESIKYDLTAWA